MSTKSKRRIARRAWMHEAVEKYTAEGLRAGHHKGYREGAEKMRADMMALVPRTRIEHDIDGKIHVRNFIDRFPDPREHGSNFTVPMPTPSYGQFGAGIPEHLQHVNFRPIRNAFTRRGFNGAATLEWFTWEPTEGSDELQARTRVLVKSNGKLAYAVSLIRQHLGTCPDPALEEAGARVDEVYQEIRRVLGDFAPDQPLTFDESLESMRRARFFGYGTQGFSGNRY